MERGKLLRDWVQQTLFWLDKQFGQNLIAAVVHLDENHPHSHYFVVGDSNKTHPGLRARYADRMRLESKKEKDRKYRNALTQFLDDHHPEVCSRFGMARKTRVGATCWIRDRTLANRVKQLEPWLVDAGDDQGLEQLGEIVRDAPKMHFDGDLKCRESADFQAAPLLPSVNQMQLLTSHLRRTASG